ncbi:MAG: DNA methyltransferase [Nostoc sp.]
MKLCTEPGDIVLEPFAGSNMTGRVAKKPLRKGVRLLLISSLNY